MNENAGRRRHRYRVEVSDSGPIDRALPSDNVAERSWPSDNLAAIPDAHHRPWYRSADEPALPPHDDHQTDVLAPLTDDALAVLDSLSGEPEGEHPNRRARRADRRKSLSKRLIPHRGRRMMLALTTALFLVPALGFAGIKLLHWEAPGKDFPANTAGPTAVVQVRPGDTAEQIARTMTTKGVVASGSAFYKAAIKNDAMPSVQPGYYALPSHIPATDAVAAMVDKNSRIGNLIISDGRQLFDSRDASTGAVKEGIYRKIVQASCYGPMGKQHCADMEQLEVAGATPDLAALGVPNWAVDPVRQVPDHKRQLEGLIGAGSWDFDPTAAPTEILRQLISASAAGYEATGLLQAGAAMQKTPYQMLIAASLVEREALPQDMTKVARVIFNRLAIYQPLEFDSTVNYALAETAVATTDADRGRVTPWNTYASPGLPATPISSPSIGALKAVESPAPGPWLYFVTIDKQGTTLFTADYKEHLRNIKLAEGSGILDGKQPCPPSGCPR